jgi:hypothetical protein
MGDWGGFRLMQVHSSRNLASRCAATGPLAPVGVGLPPCSLTAAANLAAAQSPWSDAHRVRSTGAARPARFIGFAWRRANGRHCSSVPGFSQPDNHASNKGDDCRYAIAAIGQTGRFRVSRSGSVASCPLDSTRPNPLVLCLPVMIHGVLSGG